MRRILIEFRLDPAGKGTVLIGKVLDLKGYSFLRNICRWKCNNFAAKIVTISICYLGTKMFNEPKPEWFSRLSPMKPVKKSNNTAMSRR